MQGYVCSYTHEGGAGGNGRGITAITLDPDEGRIVVGEAYAGASPTWLAIAPNRRRAYAVNEVDNFGGARAGSVTAYAIGDGGALRRLNAVASGGTMPAHCSVHPAGRHVLVANYGGGQLAVLPIRADGSLGEAAHVRAASGDAGPVIPAAAPPGSFARSGHDGPHAHMIAADPSGHFILSNDLGTDRTYIWTLAANGALAAHDPPFFAATSPGAGPRHFAFHPHGRILYNLYEEASALAVYAWDGANGTAAALGCVSTLPAGFAGSSFASALTIARDGRFLYAANRLHNSIAIFALEDAGMPRLLDHEWTRGDYPNHIALDPTGSFLLACNRRSDQVTLFRIDRASGALRFTGQYVPLGSPNMTAFVA